MAAQELYDGMARAVEAAKPAQEYCFLWANHWSTCMTKGEWSGWMQAFGTFLAIVWAGRIANVTFIRESSGVRALGGNHAGCFNFNDSVHGLVFQ